MSAWGKRRRRRGSGRDGINLVLALLCDLSAIEERVERCIVSERVCQGTLLMHREGLICIVKPGVQVTDSFIACRRFVNVNCGGGSSIVYRRLYVHLHRTWAAALHVSSQTLDVHVSARISIT